MALLRSRLVYIFVAVTILLSMSSAMAAGGFRVTPTKLEVGARQTGSALTITNLLNQNVTIQIKVMEWTQDGNEQQLELSRDVIFSPPIVNIPPGADQIVRFRLRRGADQFLERAYRVYVQQLQSPSGASSNTIKVKFGVPLFVKPLQPTEPRYLINVQQQSDRGIVNITNYGTEHIRVKRVVAFPASAEQIRPDFSRAVGATSKPVEGSYDILPGASRQWVVPFESFTDENVKYRLETDYFNRVGWGEIQSDGTLWITDSVDNRQSD